MKPMHRIAIPSLAAVLAMSAPLSYSASNTPNELLKEAKVTEAQAQATALAKVPHGTVKSSELEKEHGRLIWTFDIAPPSARGVTEVHVDAKTGKVISVKKETPAQEAKEAKAEKNSAVK